MLIYAREASLFPASRREIISEQNSDSQQRQKVDGPGSVKDKETKEVEDQQHYYDERRHESGRHSSPSNSFQCLGLISISNRSAAGHDQYTGKNQQ